jgi:hypothetical protein
VGVGGCRVAALAREREGQLALFGTEDFAEGSRRSRPSEKPHFTGR